MTHARTGRIIAYTGTHGTGKTTATFRRAALEKPNSPTKTIGVVCEVASLCPYPINIGASHDAQLWIFSAHIQAELVALKHYDIVISDRTCVDSIAYTWVCGHHALALAMIGIAACHLPNYQEINLLRASDHPYWMNDGCREATNALFRESVESELISLYRRLEADITRT